MKRIAALAVLVLALALGPGFGDHRSGEMSIVSLGKAEVPASRLRALDLDLLMERDGRVYILASPADLERLRASGLSYRLEKEIFAPALSPEPGAEGDVNGAFHSYPEVESELQTLEASYPGLAKLYSLGDSLEGRHIYGLKVSADVELDEDEARVLFLGCHHAREWISVEVPLLLAEYLLEHYDSDSAVRDLVDRAEIWIVPLVNPDGLQYSIYDYRYWRKNRRDNGDGSYGVDLNRNYGYAWGWDDSGSSPVPASEIYRGPAPFSEPEIQAVRDLIASRKFEALISYHSFAQEILYPWGYITTPPPDAPRLDELARGISERIQAVNGDFYSYGQAGSLLYLTNGDLTDWAYGEYGVLAFTVELPPPNYLAGAFFNSEAEIQPIFNENLPSMTYLISETLKSFVPLTSARERAERKNVPPGRDQPPVKR
jgi:carboxypeptidase T